MRLILPVLAASAALGAGAAMSEEPLLDLSAANVTDVLTDVSGGLRRQTRFLDKFDVTAAFVGDNHERPGWSAFLDLQATNGGNFSASVSGDAEVISNIEAPAGTRVLDAWIARDFNGEGGVKTGIVDLNTEFDVQATGALFLNASHGIGPDFSQAGQNGPSIFPAPGLGAVGWLITDDHWQIKAGIFEGISGDPAHPGRTALNLSSEEGALLVFEARNHISPDFVVGGGVWHFTAPFDTLDAAKQSRANTGAYAIADGVLYAAPEGDRAGLSGWLRAGFANGDINPVDATIGGGLVYTGPFGRKADQAGIAFSYIHFGTQARRAALVIGDHEANLEATYSFGIGDHLIVQPDIQYVLSPGADTSVDNALVMGSRIVATW
jgi:porin